MSAKQHQETTVHFHSNIWTRSLPCALNFKLSSPGVQQRWTTLGSWWGKKPSVVPTVRNLVSAPESWSLYVDMMGSSMTIPALQSVLELLSIATPAAPVLPGVRPGDLCLGCDNVVF